jgi:hypothetical protein
VRRSTGNGVRPDLRLGDVETVQWQAIGAVSLNQRSGVNQVELQRDVVPRSRVVGFELVRPARVEDVEHVDSVEPHLDGRSWLETFALNDWWVVSLACSATNTDKKQHIDTYLINISREAMIKPSIRRPEAAIDLIAQGLRGGFVDFFAARQVVHVEEGVAEAGVVDRVAVVVG